MQRRVLEREVKRHPRARRSSFARSLARAPAPQWLCESRKCERKRGRRLWARVGGLEFELRGPCPAQLAPPGDVGNASAENLEVFIMALRPSYP